MRDVRASAPVMADPGEIPSPNPLERVRKIGYAILALQLAAFMIWSAVLYSRFSVTSDYATYNQPWYLIAHGNLDPYSTISNIPFWQNDAEFMPWVLAPFYWLLGGGIALPLLQAISLGTAEMVVFAWICEVTQRHLPGREARWAAELGLLLLIANPWVWWTLSFDVHEEVFVIVFVVLLAWDVAHDRRRAWLWVPLVMAGGAPSATYVIGIGIGSMLLHRRLRSQGAMLAVAAIVYSGLIIAIHGDVGVSLTNHYGNLVSHGSSHLTTGGLIKGVVARPQIFIQQLRLKLPDMIANVAPSGLIGLAAPMLMPLMLVVLVANSVSNGFFFAEPLFQSIPIYVLLPLGTVVVLLWIARRRRRIALLLGGVVAAQALGWAVVWGPRTPGQWLRIPGPTAATLAAVEARIPATADVIVSQGVIGRFSSRAHIYSLGGRTADRVYGKTWIVIVPREGIETTQTAVADAIIGELAGPLHAKLITHSNGVWAFVWNPPPSMHDLPTAGNMAPLPAWIFPGVAGRPVLAGPETDWHVTSTGNAGYVVDELEWLAAPSRYDAAVTLSTTGPVNVEVWNDTGNVLLARRQVVPTGGIQTVSMPVNATVPYKATAYSGWGPFHADFTQPPAGERLEVRVWSPGNALVNVYNADLTAVPAR